MDFEKEKRKAINHATRQKQKAELYEIKHSYDKKLTFGKWAFIFMMVNCTVVEIFSMVAMFMFMDLSPLPSLITAVIGECISLCSYNYKSQKENSAHGITYELAMREYEGGEADG